MDIVLRLVHVGLRGGDGEADIAINFHHGQLGHLTHGRTALLNPNKKVYIRFFKAVGDEIIALKTAVAYKECLLRESVSFQHFYRRADFVLLGFGLNHQVSKCAVENVIQRCDVQLVDAFRNTVILNKGRG